MAIGTEPRTDGAPGALDLDCRPIGHALVVHPKGQVSEQARDMALGVAEDPDHDLVLVDLPANCPIWVWELVAQRLSRGKRGIRLVISGRSRETAAMAGQWLAERLRRTVLAPDGTVVAGSAGSLFVHAGRDSGWVRFTPGKAPKWEAKRFPRPRWENSAVEQSWPTSSAGIAEPVPGGTWLRPVGAAEELREHRRMLVGTLLYHQDVLSVVLGYPGAPPLSADDIVRYWAGIPPTVRGDIRFVQFGPLALADDVSPGQALADLVREPVTCSLGIPTDRPGEPGEPQRMYTLCRDGSLGWSPYVRELRYRPRENPDGVPQEPVVTSYRAPATSAVEVSPRVFWYAPDAVIEVVRAGLWMRPPDEPANAAIVRSMPLDPDRLSLVFDASTERRAARMGELAADASARLEPQVRSWCRMMPAPVASTPAPVGTRGRAGGVEESGSTTGTDAGTDADAGTDTDVQAGEAGEAASGGQRTEAVHDGAAVQRGLAAVTAPSADGPAAVPEPLQGDPAAEPPQEAPLAAATAATAVTAASPVALRLESTPDLPLGDPAETGFGADPAADGQDGDPRPAPPEATAEPEAPQQAVAQPAPAPEASATSPAHGLDKERAWLRRTLSDQYDALANLVARLLSERPGMRSQDSGRPDGDVITDLVALRMYLADEGAALDEALQTASVGPHVPFARCAAAGLRRLPSHRGTSVLTTQVSPEQWRWYQDHPQFTDYGFLNATVEPLEDLPGDCDILIWSVSARRTTNLEPPRSGLADRVLFSPGTGFRVLRMDEESTPSGRRTICLRELTRAEAAADGKKQAGTTRRLDEVALRTLDSTVASWGHDPGAAHPPAAALPELTAARFSNLPGLLRTR